MNVRFHRLRHQAPVAALALAGLVGCATTQKAPIENKAAICSFLGTVCPRLTPGGEGQPDLRYVDSNARWSQYTKVLVDPVIMWSSTESQVSPTDQQTLTNYFYSSLKERLGKKFQLADQVGPGTMRLQVVLTDAQTATPGLRTLTMAIPQAHALSTLGYLATGSYPFVGAAQGAAKLSDSLTGQLLAAVASRRVGGGSIEAAGQWTLGDAENAIDYWAERMATKLHAWTSGAEPPR